MLHTRKIIFSLLCVFTISLSMDSTTQDSDSHPHMNIKPLTNPITLSETEIEEMKLVLDSSPVDAQLIVNHLQDPTYFPDDKDYRSAIFFGVPGSGKTIMAKAIGYEMEKKGWDCKFVSSTSLFGEHRNQTSIRLTNELESIVASKKPTLIIIDELNRLLDNANSKHHDTDSTSTALWTFLDSQEGNENFFLIGTMNCIDKLPQPFKSRIITDYINFPLITDPKIKNKLVRIYLTTKNSLLDNEVTDDFLNKELEKINDCAGRCLKKVSRSIGRTNRKNELQKTSVTVIKKTAITQVVNEYIQRKLAIKYDWVDETDDERQERHHKESIAMQKKHFIQQELIQICINNGQKMNGINGTSLDSIYSLFSDEQIQIAETMTPMIPFPQKKTVPQ